MPAMSPVRRFLRGAGFLFSGFATLLATPGTKRLAVLPIAASVLVFAALGAGGVWLAARLGSAMADGAWGTFWAWVTGVVALAAFAVFWLFAFGMFTALVAAPFNELISQRVELALTGSTGEVADGRGVSAGMLRAALAAGKLLAAELAVMLPALVLLFIPVLGVALYGAPACFFLALGHLDRPLDRRRLGLRRKLSFCWANLPETLGFGAAAYLGMMVPLFNLLTIPAAAAGATRLYLDLEARLKSATTAR